MIDAVLVGGNETGVTVNTDLHEWNATLGDLLARAAPIL